MLTLRTALEASTTPCTRLTHTIQAYLCSSSAQARVLYLLQLQPSKLLIYLAQACQGHMRCTGPCSNQAVTYPTQSTIRNNPLPGCVQQTWEPVGPQGAPQCKLSSHTLYFGSLQRGSACTRQHTVKALPALRVDTLHTAVCTAAAGALAPASAGCCRCTKGVCHQPAAGEILLS